MELAGSVRPVAEDGGSLVRPDAPVAPARSVAPEVIEPEPPERQDRTRTLTDRVLSVRRRLQPSTWGLLALVTLNLILIPFAVAKGG